MNTFEILYTDTTNLPVDTEVVGKTIKLPAEKPDCGIAYVTFNPVVGDRTVDIKLQLGDKDGDFFDLAEDGTISVSSNTIVQIDLGGGPTSFRLTYTAQGTAGADSTIKVSIAGMPTGTQVLP